MRNVQSVLPAECPRCGLSASLAGGGCECGTYWGPLPSARLNREEWEAVFLMLMTRSGGLCELRSAACLTRGGDLRHLPRERASIHHRQPRGMGGTRDAGVHALSRLVLICGTGNTGCHGWLEGQRTWGYDNGWLVRHAVPGRSTPDTDPALVPIVLRSGRRVRLDDVALEYLPPLTGPSWVLSDSNTRTI